MCLKTGSNSYLGLLFLQDTKTSSFLKSYIPFLLLPLASRVLLAFGIINWPEKSEIHYKGWGKGYSLLTLEPSEGNLGWTLAEGWLEAVLLRTMAGRESSPTHFLEWTRGGGRRPTCKCRA